MNGFVVGDHPLPNVFHSNKAGGHRHIDEWCAAPPTIWVAVLNRVVLDQASIRLDGADDFWIRFLDIQAHEVADGCFEAPFTIDALHDADTHLATRREVLFTEVWSHMDQAGTVARGDMVRGDHLECVRVVFEIVEERLIFQPDEVAPRQGLQNLNRIAEYRFGACFSEDVCPRIIWATLT